MISIVLNPYNSFHGIVNSINPILDPKSKQLQGFVDQTLSPSQVKDLLRQTYRHTHKRGGRKRKKVATKRRIHITILRVKEKYWTQVVYPGLVAYAKRWNCGILHVYEKKKNRHKITFYLDNHPFSTLKEQR